MVSAFCAGSSQLRPVSTPSRLASLWLPQIGVLVQQREESQPTVDTFGGVAMTHEEAADREVSARQLCDDMREQRRRDTLTTRPRDRIDSHKRGDLLIACDVQPSDLAPIQKR